MKSIKDWLGENYPKILCEYQLLIKDEKETRSENHYAVYFQMKKERGEEPLLYDDWIRKGRPFS